MAGKMEKHAVIEEEIDRLFADLGEVEPAPASAAAPAPAAREGEDPASKTSGGPDSLAGIFIPGLIETLHEEESRLDPFRVLVLEYVHALAGFIQAARKGQASEIETASASFLKAIRRLEKMPGHDGRVLVRHQGRGVFGEGKDSAAYDYVMLCGPLRLDVPQVRAAAKRLGKRAPGIADQFVEDAQALARAGVANFHAAVSYKSDEERARARQAVAALAHFHRVVYAGFDAGKKFQIIHDESNRPDPNLTMMAAVSGLQAEAVRALLDQVGKLMLRAGTRDPIQQYTSMYDALFGFKKLLGVVQRPPVEINHVRWLVAAYDSAALPASQARLARLVASEFAGGFRKAARIMDTLYAEDMGYVDACQLAERLGLVSGLLAAIHAHAAKGSPLVGDGVWAEILCEAVLGNMEERLERVSGEIFENIAIHGDEIEGRSLKGETERVAVDPGLMELVAFFRQRAHTRKKMKAMPRLSETFNSDDYKTIARDFGITSLEAQELTDLLRACFDKKGHFARSTFEANLSAFCKHEKHVFEFLWTYLKEHLHKEDRIALLNALQALIDRMRQPKKAIQVLLTGFLAEPEVVSFPDRNALMLTTVLLRKFNKELTQDTDQTPEEVLFVVEGLDDEAAGFAREMLDRERERLFLKIRTMHRKAKGYLRPNNPHGPKPLEYVLSLEREVYILLSLVGGEAAATVLRSALKEYGNPSTQIYRAMSSQEQLARFWTILMVVIRGIGRTGGAEDIKTLQEVRSREPAFQKMATAKETQVKLRQVVKWIDRSTRDLLGKD
jgi:ferritin